VLGRVASRRRYTHGRSVAQTRDCHRGVTQRIVGAASCPAHQGEAMGTGYGELFTKSLRSDVTIARCWPSIGAGTGEDRKQDLNAAIFFQPQRR
jgi:hypothetical protein